MSEMKKSTDLEKLYIENYSNTEFVSEEDVYEYLKHFSAFLRHYDEWSCWNKIENSDLDEYGLMLLWQDHLKNLCIELFNSFLYGNLLTAAAMTRTLIECYVYIRVLIEEENPELLEDWFLSSLIKHVEEDKCSKTSRNNIRKQVEAYCNMLGRKYKYEKRRLYKWRQDNKWLSGIIDDDYITMKGICKHLKEKEIYDDYSYLCSFIHGQDVLSKMQPFLFYSSIYSKLFIMSLYIFKAIRLFEIDDSLENEIQNLEEELYQLGETYLE